jgi:transposase
MTKTDEKWVERIREWKGSGKTAEEFTAGQPYKASTLKWKAAQLRRSGERVSAGPIPMARVVSRGRVEVARGASGVVVEVSGARISLSRGFDAELLSEVVRALGAAL